MHLFKWLVPKKKAVEGLVMRISTADQVDYVTITEPSDSDIWDALVQLPTSYDSLYLTYGDKRSRSFIFVEYEDDKYLFMATRNGIVKKTPIKDYENIRKNGLAAINLREDDKLIEVKVTDNSEDILLFTRFGQCIRFKETDVRSTGRTTMGVIGMNLAPNDVIIAMQTASMGEAVLLVSSNGLGKRTRIDEFTTQNRGGKGVKCYKITEKSGNLVGVKSVENDDELMLITTEGIIIRIQVSDVTVLGRITTGVKLINLKEGVSVASIAKVVEDKTLMPPEEAKEEADELENSDENSAENNNSHAEAIENNTEA